MSKDQEKIQIFVCGVKRRVCSHPEARGGEVWFTNLPKAKVPAEVQRLTAAGWCPRVGTTAYSSDGGVVAHCMPIFIAADARPDVQHVCRGYCANPGPQRSVADTRPEPETGLVEEG